MPRSAAADELRVLAVEQRDDRARRERDDLVDQPQRVLVVVVHDDHRQVGILARDRLGDLARSDGELGHLVAEVAQDAAVPASAASSSSAAGSAAPAVHCRRLRFPQR